MATQTYAKRVKAREESGSGNFMKQKMGAAVMSVDNYRRGSGKMTPIGSNSQISSTTYWT